MRPLLYTLIGQTPVPCYKVLEWAYWFDTNTKACQVALTKVGPYTISTVFLGVNHNHSKGPPRLFETMAWVEAGDHLTQKRDYISQKRCATWAEAEAQHRETIAQIKEPQDEVKDLMEAEEGQTHGS